MGRVMKYELRSALRLFIPLWLGALAIALVNGLALTFEDRLYALTEQSELLSMLLSILMLLYIVVIFGIVIFALIYVILRFYQGLLKDEGYLTLTLPLRIDAILWGKALSALILMVISGMVALLSVVFLFIQGISWNELPLVLQETNRLVNGQLPLLVVLLAVLCVVSVLPTVMQLYLAMGLGQLAKKRRVGASVLAYVGIDMILSAVMQLITAPVMMWLMQHINDVDLDMILGNLWLYMLAMLLYDAVLTVLFYVPTRHIFSRRINLE